MTRTLIVLAGMMGASGIVFAAAAAHAAPGAGLDSAAYMLLLHTTAVISGVALLQLGLLLRPLMFVILAAWVLGSALFSGDIALRAFTGHRLFALAAPTGGIILIVAWLGLVAAAVPWFGAKSKSPMLAHELWRHGGSRLRDRKMLLYREAGEIIRRLCYANSTN